MPEVPVPPDELLLGRNGPVTAQSNFGNVQSARATRVSLASTGQLHVVKYWCSRASSPATTVRCHVWSDLPGKPDNDLAQSDSIAIADLPAVGQLVEFTGLNVTLTGGVNYWVGLVVTAGGSDCVTDYYYTLAGALSGYQTRATGIWTATGTDSSKRVQLWGIPGA